MWWKGSGGFHTDRPVHSRLDACLKDRVFLIFYSKPYVPYLDILLDQPFLALMYEH